MRSEDLPRHPVSSSILVSWGRDAHKRRATMNDNAADEQRRSPSYRGVSASPLHGSFTPGFDPGPSDLENLRAGRERKLGDLVDQSEFERLVSSQIDIAAPPRGENIIGNARPVAQNLFSSLLVRQGSL